MKLYIKYIDGKVVDHPILEENLRQINPQFDPVNLPETLKPFERIPAPIVGPYTKVESTYQLNYNGVVRDVHTEVEYTEEERAAKILMAQEQYHPNGWVFNENICGWEPPMPPPDDGIPYVWSNEQETWTQVIT